jgi:hypothetical protein
MENSGDVEDNDAEHRQRPHHLVWVELSGQTRDPFTFG